LKVRQHIKKVEEIRNEQAARRKASTENLKVEIEAKLTVASQKKEEELEKKIATAVKSASKKEGAQKAPSAQNK
jgi:hypothetical protein